MNPIPEHQPTCYESEVEELFLRSSEQFEGDFVTGIHIIFARPDLTDSAEVQIYPCFGYQNDARSELREQFQAGRVFMKANLMFNCDVPWRVIESPAYRAALKAKRKNQSAGGDGK
jgi:hypothetical protein